LTNWKKGTELLNGLLLSKELIESEKMITWDDVICKKDDTLRNNDVYTSPEEKKRIQEVQLPTSQSLLDDSSCTKTVK
jgi:hypothetical protein